MARLDSWKEIAVHLRRRVRTVQRWEAEEGLPVHRHAHRRRGTVYAWTEELDAWLATRQVVPSAIAAPAVGAGAIAPAAAVAAPSPRRAASALAAALGAVLLVASGLVGARLGRSAAMPRVDRDPDWVLTARYLLNRDSGPELERARALCAPATVPAAAPRQEAVARECVAEATLGLVRLGLLPRRDGLARAGAEAERALALDPRRPLALTVLARTAFARDWDAAAAEARLRRAIALDPGAAAPHHELASLLSLRGRHEEAIAELRQAQRTAPLSAAINDDGCWYFYRARRYGEAIVEAERALVLEPGRTGALECIVDARAARGEDAAAQAAAVALLRAERDPAAAAVAAAAPAQARTLFERRLLEHLVEKAKHGPVPIFGLAALHAELGDRDAALADLERAAAEHDPVLLLVRVHPAFDSLRDDPRLERLLDRAGA